VTNTVLVLGATGKTGRRLIPRLAARGVEVRAASRKPADGRIQFHWDRPDTYGPALAGVDAIYAVGPQFVEDPSEAVGRFLERAAAAGVTRVVALSSLGVEFPNEAPASGRLKVEREVMTSGLEWTILRPTGFAQNFSEGFLLAGILGADMTATASGDGAVAFVDADDIAAVAAVALVDDGHAGAKYAITGPEALTFAEATAIIGRAAGRSITHRKLSASELTHILQEGGVPPEYAAMVVGDQEAIRDGFGSIVTDVVERVSGRPATRFADYAAQAKSAWIRS
jgi:uncharacterized protein YbjT (DUF2867 family)